MYRYGAANCNRLSKKIQDVECCIFAMFVMCCCPMCFCNYCCYHSYSEINNCCYKMSSRTKRLFETYKNFRKCRCSIESETKKNERIEFLTKVLENKIRMYNDAYEKKSLAIEQINSELSILKLKFLKED